jgi:hypothetical protein
MVAPVVDPTLALAAGPEIPALMPDVDPVVAVVGDVPRLALSGPPACALLPVVPLVTAQCRSG